MQELSRNIELDSFTNLKCPINGHKKLFTHICTKPNCTKSRLYCSKCILLPNYECSGNIVLLEDLILQNYDSLEGWIPDQCIRDLLNREESDESFKIPNEKDIKDYLNKKLDGTIACFMEEISRSIESIKDELTYHIKKEFDLRKECFKRIKEYYDCDIISEIFNSATNVQTLQIALNEYFNVRNIENQNIIIQAAKIINNHPLKGDQLKSVMKNFNELKGMINRLIKIEPKKFEENTMKLNVAINSVNNIRRRLDLSNSKRQSYSNLQVSNLINKIESNPMISGSAGGGSFGYPAENFDGDNKYPLYDKPFNLESYLKKTHSHANIIMTPIRSITPSIDRCSAKTLPIDTINNTFREHEMSNIEYNTTGATPKTSNNTPKAARNQVETRKQQHFISNITKHEFKENIMITSNCNTLKTASRERSINFAMLNDQECFSMENTPLNKRDENTISCLSTKFATIIKNNHSNTNIIESIVVGMPALSRPQGICTPSQFNSNLTVDSRKNLQTKQCTNESVLVNLSPSGYRNLKKPPKKSQTNGYESIMANLSPGANNQARTTSNTEKGKKFQKPLSLIESEYVEMSPGGNSNSKLISNTDCIKKIIATTQKVESKRHVIDQDIKRKLFSIPHLRGATKG